MRLYVALYASGRLFERHSVILSCPSSLPPSLPLDAAMCFLAARRNGAPAGKGFGAKLPHGSFGARRPRLPVIVWRRACACAMIVPPGDHVAPGCGFGLRFFPLWGPAISRPPCVPWINQSQWLAAEKPLRASPRECGASLPAQILLPGWTVIFLHEHLPGPVPKSLFPAFGLLLVIFCSLLGLEQVDAPQMQLDGNRSL